MITADRPVANHIKKGFSADRLDKSFWLVSGVMLLALGVRLYHLDESGLFLDEIDSVLVATDRADPLLIQFDSARPLYFLLLKAWLNLGTGEVWLRLLSVFFGVLNVALVYKLGSLAASRQAGFAAALVLALSPHAVDSSQIVRMYTMGTSLVLMGSLALISLPNAQSRRPIFLWVVLRLLSVVTLPLTVLMLAADALLIWINVREIRFLKTLMAGMIAIILLWSPFAYKLLFLPTSLYDLWRSGLESPPVSDFLKHIINFTCTADPTCLGPPLHNGWSYAYILLIPVLLFAGLMYSKRYRKVQWCMVWACVPLAMMFVWSHFAPSLFVPRYLMFTAPFFFILIGAGWASLSGSRLLVSVVAVIFVVVISHSLSHHLDHPVHEDWRPVADYVMANEKHGDKIAVWGVHSWYPMRFYYRGLSPIFDVALVHKPEIVSADDFGLKLQGLEVSGVSRLWVINRAVPRAGDGRNRQLGMFRYALYKHFNVLKDENLGGMDIYLVEPL